MEVLDKHSRKFLGRMEGAAILQVLLTWDIPLSLHRM